MEHNAPAPLSIRRFESDKSHFTKRVELLSSTGPELGGRAVALLSMPLRKFRIFLLAQVLCRSEIPDLVSIFGFNVEVTPEICQEQEPGEIDRMIEMLLSKLV